MLWAAVFKNPSFCLLSAQNWNEKISLTEQWEKNIHQRRKDKGPSESFEGKGRCY
jgi:hypothetical protein